jgi:hypothetical protein
MNWNTLYIKGKYDFRGEVRKKLESSELDFMPGYIESPGGRSDLLWISDQTTLREVKEAIGAKLIWKYRLQFFTTLESFIESKENSRFRKRREREDDMKTEESMIA